MDHPTLFRFSLSLPCTAADDAVAALWELAPNGFEEEEEGAGETASAGQQRVTYRLYAEPPEAEGLRAGLEALLPGWQKRHGPAVELREERLPNRNWREAWKEHFTLQRVGPFVIRPSWIPYEPAAGERVIHLDPGSAFGSGLHETTRLCLLALPALPAEGAVPTEVLDFGTGTGILAIAACLLWPCRVVAVDDDPLARVACRENAERNDVSARIQTGARLPGLASADPAADAAVDAEPVPDGSADGSADASADGSADASADGSADASADGSADASADASAAAPSYDLVLANIQRPVLLEHAAALVARTAVGGHLILSGLLAADEARLCEAYQAHGLTLCGVQRQGDWIALRLTRRAR